MAEEIWNATDGRIDAFVQSVGTAASLRGVAEGLRQRDERIRIVGVEPAESPVLSGGPPGGHKIDGIGAGFVVPLWQAGLADRIERVSTREAGGYIGAQLTGGASGAVVANLMFSLPAFELSTKVRSGSGLWLGEVVATFGLLLVIFGVVRSGRGSVAPFAVGAYVGGAYFFTSSTSFANPAVTIGRMFTDTFAGIAPGSVPGFLVAQVVGLLVGVGLLLLLYPDVGRAAEQVVVPREPAARP